VKARGTAVRYFLAPASDTAIWTQLRYT